MAVDQVHHSLDQLSRNECQQLLRTVCVGRFGASVDALPVVLPVNYTLFENDILVRTFPGTKLNVALANSVVAFEVDSFEPDGRAGWSVLVQGIAHEITNAAELLKARSVVLPTWAYETRPDRLLRISTQSMSGRWFGKRPLTVARSAQPASTLSG